AWRTMAPSRQPRTSRLSLLHSAKVAASTGSLTGILPRDMFLRPLPGAKLSFEAGSRVAKGFQRRLPCADRRTITVAPVARMNGQERTTTMDFRRIVWIKVALAIGF